LLAASVRDENVSITSKPEAGNNPQNGRQRDGRDESGVHVFFFTANTLAYYHNGNSVFVTLFSSISGVGVGAKSDYCLTVTYITDSTAK
jgi:hypothetical protein